jgi:hypothetical protein
MARPDHMCTPRGDCPGPWSPLVVSRVLSTLADHTGATASYPQQQAHRHRGSGGGGSGSGDTKASHTVLTESTRLRIVDWELAPRQQAHVRHSCPTLRWLVEAPDCPTPPLPRFFEAGAACTIDNRHSAEPIREIVFELLEAGPGMPVPVFASSGGPWGCACTACPTRVGLAQMISR